MPLCIWFSWTLSSPTLTLLVRRRGSVIKRVFLRVAMVKRSKSGRGDEAKLITKAPCFLAYYPGEQYFYCDRSDPAPAIPDVSEQRGAVC